MKSLLTVPLLLSAFVVFGQNSAELILPKAQEDLDSKIQSIKADFQKQTGQLNSKIISLKSKNEDLRSEIKVLQTKFEIASTQLDSLNVQTMANSSAIAQTADKLGLEIKQTDKSNEAKIAAVDQSLNKNSLYGITGVTTAILLSGLLFGFLSRRQNFHKTDVLEKLSKNTSDMMEKLSKTNSDILAELSKTKSSLEESVIKEFSKQTDLIDSQLQLIEQQKAIAPSNTIIEPDHSLALKVASEINLIERNVTLMDAKTKGLKQLIASVGKLKDNLAANGYEMPELLGKQFHQGMKVIVASSIIDEELENGSEVISKILIPQVNFNNKMIQTAQIETSKGC